MKVLSFFLFVFNRIVFSSEIASPSFVKLSPNRVSEPRLRWPGWRLVFIFVVVAAGGGDDAGRERRGAGKDASLLKPRRRRTTTTLLK